MKPNDEVIIQAGGRPELVKAWGLAGLIGAQGVITGQSMESWTARMGLGSGDCVWTVKVAPLGATFTVPEALLCRLVTAGTTWAIKEENQEGGKTMLISVRVLSAEKDKEGKVKEEQILIPVTELVAKDANAALLRVGAENSEVIKKALDSGATLRPIVQSIG